MRRWIKESEKKVPVTSEYEVVVVGGGIAGVAAALGAARCGAKVALIEKQCALGGLATLGNVIVYLPLCDGFGHQVIKGLGEELLKTSVKDGCGRIPDCWKRGGDKSERAIHRYKVHFNPASFILALEDLVVRSNIGLYYDTRFCDVVKRRQRIEAVIVENKSGRTAIGCRTVVDASGDADVCARAGEPTVSLNTNARAAWFYLMAGREVKMSRLGDPFDPYGARLPGGRPEYAGDKAEDVTRQIVDTRSLIRKKFAELRRNAEKGSVYPFLVPTIAALRMTRRLKGEVELNESDAGQIFPDSVGMTGDWRKPGPVYSIPLRTLAAVNTRNLVTAGRCMSSASAWDVTRAIPTCAVTGQAAGVAAALMSRMQSPSLAALDVSALQCELKRQKAILKKRVPQRTDNTGNSK